MASACPDFAHPKNGFIRVWRAVYTIVTATETLYAAHIGIGHISTWMSDNGIITEFELRKIEQGLLCKLTIIFGAIGEQRAEGEEEKQRRGDDIQSFVPEEHISKREGRRILSLTRE
ncbi:MAG: hypothetical protein M1818_002743 [Claussenomyces sp. TS43310]|nr:MAG: hypothetical protein M1818_002743 [Claussenomyces sp. TS43310]